MTQIPAKPINELEKKTGITAQDSILILDSETGEARLANKEELRGVGIANIEKSKSGKTTTLTINTTDGQNYKVQLEDGADGNDGLTPQFSLEGGIFKRKFPNESEWKTLFNIEDLKGERGEKGISITSITKSKSGRTTTITINKSDNTSKSFEIQDGIGIGSITPTREGKTTKVVIRTTDGGSQNFSITDGEDGKNPEFQFSETHLQQRLEGEEEWKNLIPLSEIRGGTITNIARTEGTGAPGSTDTYTITLSDGTTQTFQVYNGKDGNGSGDMISTNNLSDLKDKAQARTNLEVYSKIETDNKLSAKQSTSTKNQANGYAGLDSNKKLDPSVIPVIATTETHTVANATARLALTPEQVQRGDYAIQTDTGEKYILSGENPASENDWTLVADTTPDWSQITNKPTTFAPASHTHTKAQVGLGNVDNTSDATKNSATATLTNKTISGDNNTITKVNSLKNLNGNAELKIRTGPTASIPTQQQAGVLYFGFEA